MGWYGSGFAPSRPVKIPVSKKPVYRPVPPVLTGTRLTQTDLIQFFFFFFFRKVISVIYFYSKFHMATRMGL